jgi:hypothetical protein
MRAATALHPHGHPGYRIMLVPPPPVLVLVLGAGVAPLGQAASVQGQGCSGMAGQRLVVWRRRVELLPDEQ